MTASYLQLNIAAVGAEDDHSTGRIWVGIWVDTVAQSPRRIGRHVHHGNGGEIAAQQAVHFVQQADGDCGRDD